MYSWTRSTRVPAAICTENQPSPRFWSYDALQPEIRLPSLQAFASPSPMRRASSRCTRPTSSAPGCFRTQGGGGGGGGGGRRSGGGRGAGGGLGGDGGRCGGGGFGGVSVQAYLRPSARPACSQCHAIRASWAEVQANRSPPQ